MEDIKVFIQIMLAIFIGNIIGFQYAKWKYYGEIDLLFWKVKNPNFLLKHNSN